MARPREVTRTMTVYIVKCDVADIGKSVMTSKEYMLFTKCNNDKAYKVACQKVEEDENITVLRVSSITQKKAYCRMAERKYFSQAEVTFLN